MKFVNTISYPLAGNWSLIQPSYLPGLRASSFLAPEFPTFRSFVEFPTWRRTMFNGTFTQKKVPSGAEYMYESDDGIFSYRITIEDVELSFPTLSANPALATSMAFVDMDHHCRIRTDCHILPS